MHTEAQTIARLKSMAFLLDEALRIADEGDSPLLGAKLSDCIDCVASALAQVQNELHTIQDAKVAPDALHNGAATHSI